MTASNESDVCNLEFNLAGAIPSRDTAAAHALVSFDR